MVKNVRHKNRAILLSTAKKKKQRFIVELLIADYMRVCCEAIGGLLKHRSTMLHSQ